MHIVHRAKPLLGTFVDIWAKGGDKEKLLQGVEKAFKKIILIQSLMSFHDETSELAKLNSFAHQKSVTVHPLTAKVLKTALKISNETNGLFDCTIAPQLVAWGYLPGVLRPGRRNGNFRDIEIFSGRKIKFHRPLGIDLGGIAKGFAVDEAVKILKNSGASSGCVNAGGDLKVFGDAEQPIYARSLKQKGKFVLIAKTKEAAVATSAFYFSKRKWRGKFISPIINPKNGIPCLKQKSVSIFAESCMIADALTKAVLVADNPSCVPLNKFAASAIILNQNDIIKVHNN